jgi:glutamyl-tRNA synthetase
MAPRVRFAPSPTGFLHVGGARTALFNWLYARRHRGVFILRIEDTDVERSSEDMVTGILDGLKWLGLDWDEGPDVGGPYAPYLQSGRLDRYRTTAQRLLASGSAYYCYCSPERLRHEREKAEQRGEAWKYDRACLRLPPERVAELEATGASRAVRFRVPEGRMAFDDAVHGRIEFEGVNIEDFVLLRSDDHPTYHLSVVVDDVDMQITDVIRGDDHISNTPKHVLLFRALEAPIPRFAHVPLILGPDKQRLSKRHGATSVTEYQRQGYLPSAMTNFLALLGWSPGDDRELLTIDDIIGSFSLEGISGGNAVFDPVKLDWMNGQYIALMPVEELVAAVIPWLRDAGLRVPDAEDKAGIEWFYKVMELLRPRAKRLTDFVALGRPFLSDTVEYEPEAIAKYLGDDTLASHLEALIESLRDTVPFDEPHVEAAVRGTAAQRDIRAGPLIHATRVAVTGRAASPGLFEVLALLGRERTIARLERLVAWLAARV